MVFLGCIFRFHRNNQQKAHAGQPTKDSTLKSFRLFFFFQPEHAFIEKRDSSFCSYVFAAKPCHIMIFRWDCSRGQYGSNDNISASNGFFKQ